MTLSQERIEQLAEVYADVFAHSAHELGMLFQSKENRDAVWREAKKRGLILRRRTTGHQVLDPRYTVEDSHLPDRGR